MFDKVLYYLRHNDIVKYTLLMLIGAILAFIILGKIAPPENNDTLILPTPTQGTFRYLD